MRFVFNEGGGLDVFPDNSAERMALLSWEARFPKRFVHEGTLEAMQMRPADAVTIKDQDFHKGA